MNDTKYTAFWNDELVSRPIEDLCKALEEKYLRQEKHCKQLFEENEKLKKGIWEKEEIARLKADKQRYYDEWLMGFPITKEQRKKINEWQKQYIKLDTKMGAIGGMFTYKFTPTSIGVSGVCIAPNGDEFEFQEIG